MPSSSPRRSAASTYGRGVEHAGEVRSVKYPRWRRDGDGKSLAAFFNKRLGFVFSGNMGEFGDLSDSCQGVWNELNKGVASKLSRSVRAIASYKGNKMVHACSGIVIQFNDDITTLLTSASLVRSFHDDSKIDNDLKIRVYSYSLMYYGGWLKHYDLEHDIAIVNMLTHGSPIKGRLRHKVEYKSGSKVIAVGRGFHSRKLMATSGTVLEKIDCEEAMFATCKISKCESNILPSKK